jgi:hypothetical protein
MSIHRHRPGRAPFLVPLCLAALLCPQAAHGQADSPPRIDHVRVGLPTGQGGQEANYSRNGAWAPVYVKLKAGKDGNPQGSYQLVVETTDGEDLPYRYTSPVPALPANDDHTALTYIRPGTDGSEFTVTLQAHDGRDVQTNPRFVRTSRQIIGPRDQLFLSLGSRLTGLRRALQPPQPGQPEAADNDLEDRGERHTAYFDDVAQMPDRWFGYDAVDVVVFTTGRKELLDQLLTETGTARLSALAEWVRRGGKLIVPVGSNHQEVARLFERVPLLDCKVAGSNTIPEVFAANVWAGRPQIVPPRKVEVALLEPGPGVLTLLNEEGEGPGRPGRRPLIVQGSFGLGMVSYVAFDLDTPPMTTWEGQTAFWQRCLDELAPRLSDGRAPPNPGMPNQFPSGLSRDRPELATELQRALDDFGTDIPTIPFYWVALFILFYILLVGPIDYFLLKKVFKRLELTWVTFPAAVILISVAAYFIAYSVKGDDRRVNKVDLVEIDLNGPGQVYGSSWWTLFSPRIQNYTLGVEPAPEWAAPPAGRPVPGSTVVEVMDRPDEGGRKGSQGLFRRPYDYAEDAAGLEHVPIPVWATRSFTALWRAPLPGGKSPIEVTTVRPRGREDDKGEVTARVTNHLPVALQGVTLFYRNHWYDAGGLEPGESATIPLGGEGKSRRLNEWFTDPILRPTPQPGQTLPSRVAYSQLPNALIKPLLFFEESRSQLLDSGMRSYDQSWRLRQRVKVPPREEVILVARTPYQTGKAEDVARAAAAPSRLWLDELPGPGRQRPDLRGYLTQETFIRVYVPVGNTQ